MLVKLFVKLPALVTRLEALRGRPALSKLRFCCLATHFENRCTLRCTGRSQMVVVRTEAVVPLPVFYSVSILIHNSISFGTRPAIALKRNSDTTSYTCNKHIARFQSIAYSYKMIPKGEKSAEAWEGERRNRRIVHV